MSISFFTPPASSRYALRHVRVPRCLLAGEYEGSGELADVDLLIADGLIEAIAAAGSLGVDTGPDLAQSMVLPGLIDCHTHLDKGHIWPRMPNPTGDGFGAASATAQDRSARWNAEDVRRRMEFGLMTAYAKGVVAIRTHLDSLAPQAGISFPVFRQMREQWAGRIELQASSIAPMDVFLGDEGRVLADTVAASEANLGCATRLMSRPRDQNPAELDQAMQSLFRLADERDLNVDLHVDESSDPAACTLIRIARIAVRTGFKGRILCGHCTSLALQNDEVIDETLSACLEAGIDFVSLPSVNLYLQSRSAGKTPRWRGVTVLHEMKARGLRVAVAGDNVRDPFYAYGDHDMLETFTQAVRIAHLDHPLSDWISAASASPAAIMGLPGRGRILAGTGADLIVLKARDYSEMLSRSQFDRSVLRRGRAIDTSLPDYRVLDDLMAH
jgi:cytosine deaminase